MPPADSPPPDGGHTSLGDSPNNVSDRSDRSLPTDPLSDRSLPPHGNPNPNAVPNQSGSVHPHGLGVASSSGTSAQPRPDRFSSVGGDTAPKHKPILGLQQPTTHMGGFPKISSNFDKPTAALQVQPLPESNNERKQDIPCNNVGVNSSTPQQKKSFVEAAARRSTKPPDIFAHNFNMITPVKMNEGLTIIMPEDLYEQRLASFQFALIGRLMLPQGSAPRSVDSLKGELTSLFKFSGDWTLMPLGKGFFSLNFILQEDQLKAARQTSWKLSAGYMQIRNWKPDFDPYKELSSTAQIWVRLYHLPAEYWHPEFLVGIFRSVGNVIKLDGNTAHGLVGHFARALVEVDLTSPLIDTVRVGLPRNFFYVDFSYENVPLLCTFCNFVGHSVERCRKAKAAEEAENKPKDGAGDNNTKGKRRVAQQRIEKPEAVPPDSKAAHNDPKSAVNSADFPAAGVHTTNTFNALYDLENEEDEDEYVPDTPSNISTSPKSAGNSADLHAPAAKDKMAGYSVEKLLELVTVPESDQDHQPRQSTAEEEEIKAKLLAQAQETDRIRQLREELKAKRVATRSTTKLTTSSNTDLQVPADTVGQPKKKTIAPNSPHPGHQWIETKLKEARDMGKYPTAYELHPGESGDLKRMEQAVFKQWRDLPDAKDDSDYEDDSTGGSPEANATSFP